MNVQSFEIVYRGSETQPQVTENSTWKYLHTITVVKWQKAVTAYMSNKKFQLFDFDSNVTKDHAPSKHDTLTQCWFNVGPASQKVGEHRHNIGLVYRVD